MTISLPLQLSKLSPGIRIHNFTLGQEFVIVSVDAYAITIKSTEGNSIASMPVLHMNLYEWCIMGEEN